MVLWDINGGQGLHRGSLVHDRGSLDRERRGHQIHRDDRVDRDDRADLEAG